MYWFIDGMKKYFDFKGRASREAFWMFHLVIGIIGVVFVVLERLSGDLGGLVVGLRKLFSLITFIPFLSLNARRLHDIRRSGWWQLLGLAPFIGWFGFIGWLALLYFFILKGDTGTNSYGPSPLNQNGDSSKRYQNGQDNEKEPYVAKPQHNPAYK